MNIQNKSQSSTEFVVLASFMLLIFIVFIMVIQQKAIVSNREKSDAIANEVMAQVLNEIKIATSVSDSYYREFTLPSKPHGLEYNITLTSSGGDAELVLGYENREMVRFLDNIQAGSDIQVGSNIIGKSGGVISIRKKP
ncbi:TPA: hypothetical protein HA371_05535 [Candidatus Woesearchaeota archaeon]|nr:hypothetical protein [Candidatus Woesearchaeota archaeon]HIJ02342.1 hypothetical protein [Candidatus Woesearchaeota archaeon]HIJ14180.1 hypothetical protein [Candidatus Woesearchaeota archaeon]